MYDLVVMIDDSKLDRYLNEAILNGYEFAGQVKSFNSAMDALVFLKSLVKEEAPFPDMIFVDIQMPVMTGFDFLDKYLAFPADMRKLCKIVILSSTDAYEDHMRMKNYPVIDCVVTKPLTIEKLKSLSKPGFE